MKSWDPLLAAPDLGEVIYVIIFLVVAGVNWAINLWKQSKENAERAKRTPIQEEQEARERAWQEQTRRVGAPPAREPAEAPPSPRGALKDLFEELKRAAQEAQNPPPPQPPPLPQQPLPRQTVPPPQPAPARRPSPPPVPVPVAAPVPVPAPARMTLADRMTMPDATRTHEESARRALVAYQTGESRRRPHPLTALLHTEAGYRQAFVLKEVLDTPVGMRDTPWEEQIR